MIFPISTLNAQFKRFTPYTRIISVWGDFGVGKTTFALQTAMISTKNDGKSIFIYSKPNFPFEKIHEIFKDPVEQLDKITFIQPESFNDLYKIVFNLEFLILTNLDKKIDAYKFIVIDSLTDLYRLELNREKKEMNYNLNYNLNQILATLTYLIQAYNINILIVNEKVNRRTDEETIEVQSGGKVMDYWVLLDIKIERTETLSKRKFILTKHPEHFRFKCNSKLTKSGFQ